MQNSDAALIKVAGTTIHLHSSQSITGSVRCHRTRNLEVSLVYDRGIGIPMSCSQTPIPSRKQDSLDSYKSKKINSIRLLDDSGRMHPSSYSTTNERC